MSEKTFSVQRTALKDLQKAQRTIVQEHLKNTRKPGSFEVKYKEKRGGSRLCGTVII